MQKLLETVTGKVDSMIKTSQKDIKNFYAFDVTSKSTDELYKLLSVEKGVTQIAYSAGGYGVNGLLVQGNSSGRLYKVTARTNALFILS